MRSPRRIAYRVGLGAAVSVLVTGAIGSLTWVSYLNTRESIIELTHERIHDVLLGLGARVQSEILRAVPAVELSQSRAAISLERMDMDDLAREFILVLRANPNFSWASYSDRSGNFTGAYRTPSGELRVSQSTIRQGRGELREHIVNENGAWTPSLHERNYKYDPRLDKFYGAAVAARRRVWVGPYIFYDEGIPGITCAVPLFTPEGSPRGVFTVDFDLEILSRFVAGLRFGQSGRVFILTSDGTVVAHPMLQPVQTSGREDKGPLPHASEMGDPLLHAFLSHRRAASLAGAPEAQFAFDYQDRRYLAGQRTVEIDSGLTWILGAVAPEADFLSVVEHNRKVALLIVTAGVGMGVLLAGLLARRITAPLTRLAMEMEEVGRFQLADRPALTTRFKEVALMDTSLLSMKRGLRSFAYYVPTRLVQSVLELRQEAKLEGDTRELTVYFSDIAGFTTQAEVLKPEELVQYLSEYLEEMTAIIAKSGGTIDKFIGDAIMAFWGAPAAVHDHAASACEAAIRSQRRLAELRTSARTPWLATLHARIGIATGEVLVGNIGTSQRFNYTVMGDTVNLASRLEGLNKHYGTEILVSEDTYSAAKARVMARPVDLVQVKGKHSGVWVYELLCLASDNDAVAREISTTCTAGFEAYQSRDFRKAAQCFQQALQLRPGDRAATQLFERSRQYLESPPPDDWTGVYVASAK